MRLPLGEDFPLGSQAPPMFRWRIRTLLLLLIATIVVWSGVSYWSEYRENAARRARETLSPPLGAQCKVVFSHRDVAADRQETLSGGHLTGTFVTQNDQWLVLEAETDSDAAPARRRLWVPRDRVLWIEVTE